MTHIIKGYAAWHPEKGFDEYHYEGPVAFADHDQTLLDDIKELNEADRTNNRKGWRIVQVEIRKFDPLPWDAYANRSFEPVEKRAAEIYEGFVYDGHGTKPAWTPGGNGTKQDEREANAAFIVKAVNNHELLIAALKEADKALEALGVENIHRVRWNVIRFALSQSGVDVSGSQGTAP